MDREREKIIGGKIEKKKKIVRRERETEKGGKEKGEEKERTPLVLPASAPDTDKRV